VKRIPKIPGRELRRLISSALVLSVLMPLAWATGCSRAPSLSNISSVNELKARFNADAGKPRLILLMSPT
jgi:hypothetical protein